MTTLLLLLRAFYERFPKAQDSDSIDIQTEIGKCIWKADEFKRIQKDLFKIDSLVINESDNDELLYILEHGTTLKEHKSKYAKNFRLFQEKIDEFVRDAPMFANYLPARIMSNCIILHIVGENLDTALRIFSTLNDRGKPLSDSEIFKAQFYKYFSSAGQKDQFIEEWKRLDEDCKAIYKRDSGSALDELFTCYMYYERAKSGIVNTTVEALRKFYEQNHYSRLKLENVWNNLLSLAQFWKDVTNQNSERFALSTLKKLFVLKYAPNGMWTYITSVYYLKNRDADGNLETQEFDKFLDRITAYIWAYAFIRPGVNSLRTPVFPEMVKILQGKETDFGNFLIDRAQLENQVDNFVFSINRPLTTSMLAWWAYQNDDQPLLDADAPIQVEHIYARGRYEHERGLSSVATLEALGNKSLLERGINIRAADYKFKDKKKYYLGFEMKSGHKKGGTRIADLILLAEKDDFTEADILERDAEIKKRFVEWVGLNNLLKQEA